MTLSFANTVGFTVIDFPNTSYPETLSVTIDVGQTIDSDAVLYKISDAGEWSVVEGAVISGETVTYSITDDGELDQERPGAPTPWRWRCRRPRHLGECSTYPPCRSGY